MSIRTERTVRGDYRVAGSERNGDANPKGESQAQPNGNSAACDELSRVEGIVAGGNEPRKSGEVSPR